MQQRTSPPARRDRRVARPSAPAHGAVSVAPWLDRLRAALHAVRAGDDPEAVHQARAALERLRVWLTLGGWRALRADARWARSRLAVLRDLDVRLALDPPDDVARDLRGRREAMRGELLAALDSPRLAGLLAALGRLPAVPRAEARDALARLARKALARGRALRAPTDDLAALHRLRRAVRRARFAQEWLGGDAAPLSALQDALGEAGDRALALGALRGGEPRRYRRRLRRELRAAVKVARARWREGRRLLEALA